jgi:hypothetical protein
MAANNRNRDGGRPWAEIECLKGQSLVGEKYSLETLTSFGRSSKCDLVLPDESQSVSRHHGRFEVEGGKVTVVDLGSSNGVFVNGAKVEKQELADGDAILIGKTYEFRFSCAWENDSEGKAKDGGVGEKGKKPGEEQKRSLLTGVIVPFALILLAMLGLSTTLKDREPPPPLVPDFEVASWQPAEGRLGVRLEIPFAPDHDRFGYTGSILTGTSEVYLHENAEVAGPVLMNPKELTYSSLGFFVDSSVGKEDAWPDGKKIVRFEGTPPRSVERESEKFQVTMERSVNLENAWESTEGTGGSQEFTLVISTGNDVTVVELYARLPNRRLIVGGLCRANVYDVFAPVIKESLMSIRLDRRVLLEPLKVEDVAKAKEWKIEAEARLTQAYLAPGNLHRAIAAFRRAIWHLPAGFVDDDIDVADLKRKLEQNCKELNDRFEARKLQVKSETTLTGRFERAVDAAEDLVQEIPDFRDDRSYLAGSIYPQVRMRFPDLKWHPKLLERIRYQ